MSVISLEYKQSKIVILLVLWAQSTTKDYIRAGNKTSIYFLVIPHKVIITAKFFKIHKISPDKNIKPNTHMHKHQIKHKFSRKQSIRYHPFKKHMKPGHAGILDLFIWFIYIRLKNFIKKEWARTFFYYYINAWWKIPEPRESMLHILPTIIS